jgi:hypothetical protein
VYDDGYGTAVGNFALRLNSTGCFLSALGFNALADQTTAIYNTALGYQGALRTTTGGCNTAVGALSFQCNTTGNSNIAIGFVALCANVEGDQSVAIGNEALRNQNPVGNADMNNVAVGFQAALCTTTGVSNTALGACSLRLNTTGCGNTAVGAVALINGTTGCGNTAIGCSALVNNTTGGSNTGVGTIALFSNTTGGSNTAVGIGSLFSNTGGGNTAIGEFALYNATTGANNIGIGVNAGRTGGSPEGIVNITTESNRIVMGNDDHTCAQIKIAWTATSDCRDKTCFKPIAHGLDFVRALKPTEYQFKQGGRDSAETDGKRRYGFLAQDILPLEGDAPVIISADNPEKLQYTESHLIPILVKAIQELTARVEELENNA